MKEIPQQSICLMGEKHFSPEDWPVAADGAVQYTTSELQDRFIGFYNDSQNKHREGLQELFLLFLPAQRRFLHISKDFCMESDFRDTFLSSICSAQDFLEEMSNSKLSGQAYNICELRNIDALHVSNSTNALRSAGIVKVTVTDTDITCGICPKMCCHHDSAARRKRKARCSLRKHRCQTRLLLEPLSNPERS